MTSAVITPVSEYLSASYRPDREYLDGRILKRNLGELDHSRVQGILYSYLFLREQAWGTFTLPEQRVQVRPSRFRVPDICVMKGGRPDEQIITQPPFLCIEILSKDDRLSEMQERIDDYLEFGVPWVWVIDPHRKRAFDCFKDGMREPPDRVLRTADPEIVVPLSELFL